MHASSGILFNHESSMVLRIRDRKVTAGVAQIVAGKTRELRLGNADAKWEWGHARENMDATRLMQKQPTPDNCVGDGRHPFGAGVRRDGVRFKARLTRYVVIARRVFSTL
jgi:GDP-D-mannose dehydratase